MSVDLDDRRNCPLAEACACGATDDLDIATIVTPIGVHCTTICRGCVDANRLPAMGYPEAAALVCAHCEHLGIDLDQMAAALEAAR